MDNNTNDNSSKKNMSPTRDLYESLMAEVYKYKLEEREMALDRYRRADEQMDTAESFILMGKNAISFLKQASDSSDGIEKLAKEIKSIVYKEDEASGASASFNDADKKIIIDTMRAEEAAKRATAAASKKIKNEDLNDTDEDY
jgi:hypothetical protein